MTTEESAEVLAPSAIAVGRHAPTQAAAIELVGAILVAEGIVTPAYVQGMAAREAVVSTYLGNGVALPHGASEYGSAILRTGLAVAQFPDGVPWGDESARLVIGLAARDEEHIAVMSRLAGILEDGATCARLATTTDRLEIHRLLTTDAEPPSGPTPRSAPGPAEGELIRTIRIANPSGLHARPAAELVERALEFEGDVTIVAGDRQANAISITQVLALGAVVGDEVTVRASGPDAEAAVAAILEVLLAVGEGS
ncbi:MAG: HPr family phosphocarrier protein [Chloroflexota bacterium]